MNPDNVPLIRHVVTSGPDDPVFDGLLLSGPVVIGILAIAGESLVSTGLVVLYLLVFVGYLPYKWYRNRAERR